MPKWVDLSCPGHLAVEARNRVLALTLWEESVIMEFAGHALPAFGWTANANWHATRVMFETRVEENDAM